MELLMRLKNYLFLIILFFAFVCCAQDKSDNDSNKVIAKIGKDYVVTIKDLKEYAVDWHYATKYRATSEDYKKALNGLIISQLKRFDFFDRKLNEDQNLMNKVRRDINNELINSYYDKEFAGKYADEKMAAKAYKEMDKEIICEDIILPFPSNPTKVEIDSLKTIALEIENGLSKNYSINELIKSHSLKDIGLNDNRKITWSESITDQVANVVFKLNTGFTRVIKSLDGFHIVKVLEINKIKLEPFEKIKDEIISKLQKVSSDVSNKDYDEYKNESIDKSSIKWNQGGLDQIVKWSANEKLYAGAYKDTIQNNLLKNNNFEILTYSKGKIDLKEYLRLLEEVMILPPNVVLNSISVKDFILDAVYDDKVVKAAQKIGLEKKIITAYTKNPVIKARLTYLYDLAVIEESIPEATPEALQKFYNDHKDSIFYQLKKINIYARIYSDSVKAAADINEIKKGIPFEKVSINWLNKAFIRERDGSLKSYRSNEPPYLANAVFKLGLNDVAGPVEYFDPTKGKQFAVIKCIYIQPEKQLTYDDVKGKRIEEEFKNYYRQKISDEVDAKLKKKYSVEIFDKAYSEAI
jgi:hypothetical protein